MTPLTKEQVDELATRMANHIPCTPASIVDAIGKAYADKAKEEAVAAERAKAAPKQ